jgi:transcriptional regulator with XRE-family HTH domain
VKSTHPIVVALAAERQRQGLTLQQLGERLGRKTYQTVWQWENGSDPRLSSIQEWADALGLEISISKPKGGGRR